MTLNVIDKTKLREYIKSRRKELIGHAKTVNNKEVCSWFDGQKVCLFYLLKKLDAGDFDA